MCRTCRLFTLHEKGGRRGGSTCFQLIPWRSIDHSPWRLWVLETNIGDDKLLANMRARETGLPETISDMRLSRIRMNKAHQNQKNY